MSTGTPSSSAMTTTGMGVAKEAMSSARPAGRIPSMSSSASAEIRGLSRSMFRVTKARLTSVRSLVCAGGSRSRIELRLNWWKARRCPGGFSGGGGSAPARGRSSRPKRRSRRIAPTSAKFMKAQRRCSSQ